MSNNKTDNSLILQEIIPALIYAVLFTILMTPAVCLTSNFEFSQWLSLQSVGIRISIILGYIAVCWIMVNYLADIYVHKRITWFLSKFGGGISVDLKKPEAIVAPNNKSDAKEGSKS
jgi:hypothetical protein